MVSQFTRETVDAVTGELVQRRDWVGIWLACAAVCAVCVVVFAKFFSSDRSDQADQADGSDRSDG